MGLGEKLRSAIEIMRKVTVFDKETIKEAVKEIQRALIAADVEVSLVLELTKKIENEAFKKLPEGLNRREHILKLTYDLLVELLGGEKHKVPEDPKKILLVGIYGMGKTTTTAKLAKYYMKRGKKVGVIAADVFRPAAFEQLQQLSEKIKAPFYGNPKEKKAEKVVEQGMKKLNSADVLIVDSAGRDALDKELVNEIKAISKTLKPEHTWLVLGADIGQVAKKQARAFHEAVGITGVIITRIDGSAKGGGALAACAVSKAPVYFIGTGEKLDDLEEFDAQRYLSRIMGYGDLQGLLEKAREVSQEEFLSPEELLKGEFNLKVFYEQLKAARKMGPLSKVAEMMGLKMQLPKEMLEVSEKKLDSFKFIMDSMTEQEMLEPEILNRARIERIAKGSGRTEEEVRELVKQYKMMKKLFKKFKKISSEKQLQKKGLDLNKLMQQFAGKKKKLKLR